MKFDGIQERVWDDKQERWKGRGKTEILYSGGSPHAVDWKWNLGQEKPRS